MKRPFKKNKKFITSNDLETLKVLHDAGLDYKKISKITGWSVNTLYNINAAGWDFDNYKRMTKEAIERSNKKKQEVKQPAIEQPSVEIQPELKTETNKLVEILTSININLGQLVEIENSRLELETRLAEEKREYYSRKQRFNPFNYRGYKDGEEKY